MGSIESIAQSYQDQAQRLSEIVVGVDQISTVVQTNSATSEQSAAASEELSGQAAAMRRQVSQFKLGEDMDMDVAPTMPAEKAKSSAKPRNPFADKY